MNQKPKKKDIRKMRMRFHKFGPRFGRFGPMYKFKFRMPPMFMHGMYGMHGPHGFGFDLELETKEDAEKFLSSIKKKSENHLNKLNNVFERIDSISANLAQNENYDAKEFQKTLIKEFKTFMIEQIDEE